MKIPTIKTKDLITVSDLDKGEIMDIFRLTASLKKEAARGRHPDFLQKKSLAMIFEKSSTRTRVSFETGVTQLGGHALFLDGNDIQLRRGETIIDTAKVLSRYVDGIMIRTFSHDNVVELAKSATVPVINGLSDEHHPCQALADVMTMREEFGLIDGLRLAFIGDGNNVAHSLIDGCAKLGMNFRIGCPEGYEPNVEVVAAAKKLGASVEILHDPLAAAKKADVLYTDVWISMGQEAEGKSKANAFKGFTIDSKLVAAANKDAVILHCLPAHYGEEITYEASRSPGSAIFDQAENRMHAQKAVLVLLMS